MRPYTQPILENQKTAGLLLLMAAVVVGFVLQVMVLPREAQAVRRPGRAAARPLIASTGLTVTPSAAIAAPGSPGGAVFLRRSRPARSSRIGLASSIRREETTRAGSNPGPVAGIATTRRAPQTSRETAFLAAPPAPGAAALQDDEYGDPTPVDARDRQRDGASEGVWGAARAPRDPGASREPAIVPESDDEEVARLPAPPPNESGTAPYQEATPDPDSGGTQMLVLGPATARDGDLVTYAISLEGARNVAHSPLRISFDPQVLRFVDAQEGPLLSSDGAATQFLAKEESGEGLVDIAISRMPPARGVTGSGILCTVTFMARGEGGSPILATGSRLLDTSGRRISFRGNDAQVAVQP